MSKFMIASEENLEHLAHYGVKGMKWRQRKAMKNTAGMTAAMRKAASKGQDASIEAENINRRERTAEAINNLIKGGSKLLSKGIKAGKNLNKNSLLNPKNSGKVLGKGLYNIGSQGTAPIQTRGLKKSTIGGGVVGGTSAVQTIVKNKKKNKH